MRSFFLSFILVIYTLNLAAETITMDLTSATDIFGTPVAYSTSYGDGSYDLSDVWEMTYSDDESHQLIYTNGKRFRLSHMPSMNSYSGASWEGFTLSRVAQDTANVFGCVANGGVAGVGTPYVIGYFSEWVSESLGYSSNIIYFDQTYCPEYIYICQNSNTMEAITHGKVFNARAFNEDDTLALIISALNDKNEETGRITHYLAVDGKKNNGWEKVSLTALGEAARLCFSMTTTDIGSMGANTPFYFAVDALTVRTKVNTSLPSLTEPNHAHRGRKIMVDSQLMIEYNGKLYTLVGQLAQ